MTIRQVVRCKPFTSACSSPGVSYPAFLMTLCGIIGKKSVPPQTPAVTQAVADFVKAHPQDTTFVPTSGQALAMQAQKANQSTGSRSGGLAHSHPAYRGGGNFARGEFCGENVAVKKGGEIFPWRNFAVTVPSFTTAAGLVFPEQGQARLRTRLCLLMP